jgi:hypothetical protein
LRSICRARLALTALLSGLLLAALLAALLTTLTARFLLLLAGFLLAALLATMLPTLTALTALLATLLPTLIWIVRHWKRLLYRGMTPQFIQRITMRLVPGTRPELVGDLTLMLHKKPNASQEPMRSPEYK